MMRFFIIALWYPCSSCYDVFPRLCDSGIRLPSGKFDFSKKSVKLAVVILNHNGYRIHNKVLKAIRNFKTPQSLKDV